MAHFELQYSNLSGQIILSALLNLSSNDIVTLLYARTHFEQAIALNPFVEDVWLVGITYS